MPKSIKVKLDLRDDADYRLTTPARRKYVATGSDAVYDITAEALTGFTGDTEISVSGLPTGASAVIGDSTLGDGESTTVTVETSGVSEGSYNFLISGVSSDAGDYDWLTVDNAGLVIDWSYAGIPGGIPARTTIHTSLGLAGQASTYVQDVDYDDINTALTNCTVEQTVYINTGTYNLTGAIDFAKLVGKTLRGAGAGKTIINSVSGSAAVTMGGNASLYNQTKYNVVSGGISKGATTVTLSSEPPASAVADNLFMIDENADYDMMWHRVGWEANGSSTRVHSHVARVVSVDGNTITFTPPNPYTFTESLSPQVSFMANGPGVSLCGIESLTLNAHASETDKAVLTIYADRFWIKNVEANGFRGDNGIIQSQYTSQCEFRRNYIHNCLGYPDQAEGYSIYLWYFTHSALVEDNVFARTATPMMSTGTSGNVWGYNYSYGNARASMTYGQVSTLCNHGPHGVMSLFEGNIIDAFTNDAYHGSTSHQFVFRNSINGINSTTNYNRWLIDIGRASYYHSFVGNVFGDDSWTPDCYEMTGSHDASYTCVYKLTYPQVGTTTLLLPGDIPWTNWTITSWPDNTVKNTTLRHGNYDYFNDSVIWDGTIPEHSMPSSLYLSSKPSWFGSLEWPPIGPEVSGYVAEIPAKNRWDVYVISEDIDDMFADEE